MALKDIMVVVDDTPAATARIDAAAALAARCDAHLVGLYVVVPLVLPAYVESELPDDLREAQRAGAEEKAARACALFNERVERIGRLARSEWRVARGNPTEVVAIQGRYSDLVIVGQIDPDYEAESPLVRAADLVFECGRPLLVVPYVGQFPVIGERILIGWNASREAARAVADARPLLVKAQNVTVLCVNPRVGRRGLGDAPGADIARHLAHHHVRAVAEHVQDDSQAVGDVLLNYAAERACDLIVLGAYGRSRLRDMVLGSLTRYMLNHMTAPVLLAH